MRFVEIQDPVEFTSYEVRIQSPNDEKTFLVITSRKVEKNDPKELMVANYTARDVDVLKAEGFDASAWKVSKAVVNERIY